MFSLFNQPPGAVTVTRKLASKAQTKVAVTFEPADIIAIFSGVIACAFAFAMIIGSVPTDISTLGIISFSGASGALSSVACACKKKGA